MESEIKILKWEWGKSIGPPIVQKQESLIGSIVNLAKKNPEPTEVD